MTVEVFETPTSGAIVHQSGWYRIGRVEVTCVPIVDEETALFARLRDPLGAARNYGARLVSRATIRALTKEAISLGTLIQPVTLPTADMRRAVPRLPGEDPKAYETRIRLPMASRAWCELHDTECWEQLEAIGWDRMSVTGNVGKWHQAGAPVGRDYLMGWWVDGYEAFGGRVVPAHFIQPGTDFGPGPHAYAQVDYATLTMLERDARG